MRRIPLTHGKFAIVDDDDYERLRDFSWYVSHYGYAVCDVGGRRNREQFRMHRLVNKTPDGFATDHINRNKLDNRKCNLRTATGHQNGLNRGRNKNNSSGHRGIIWRKDTAKWAARLKLNYKQIYLGCFDTLEDAVAARVQGEELYYGVVCREAV